MGPAAIGVPPDHAQPAGEAAISWAATGNPGVDEAVDRLRDLDQVPTGEHADIYEDVHQRLHSALTDLDAG